MLASGVAVVAHAAQSSRPAAVQDAKVPAQRRTLQTRVSLDALASGVLPRDKWRPYPDASDRAAWQNLPADLRELILQRGAEALKAEWTFLPASVFLQYVRDGNRSNFERLMRSRRERLEALVLAECVEGNGRFLDEIANGIWTTCEESWWGYPAHLSGAGLPDTADPIIDLFAAEAGSLLAWTDYLLAPQVDKVHKRVGQRLRYEIDRRILTPYEKRNDFGWMGFESDRPVNNWNPWINSNTLACTLSDRARPEASHRAGAQDPAQRRSFSGWLSSRRRMRRRSRLLGTRGRLDVRQSGTAAQREQWPHRFLRSAACAGRSASTSTAFTSTMTGT